MLRPMIWEGDYLSMLDQRGLPSKEEWLRLDSSEDVARSIKEMAVRGAPAIGIAAAYGMALAALRGEDLHKAKARLAASRPTAVNLFWALERLTNLPNQNFDELLSEAQKIEKEDLEMNMKIGINGAALISVEANVMTICNTGALATAGHGTALGIIRSAHDQNKRIHVWSCETRPRQQGLRLTAYELKAEGIPFHSIADSAAATLMKEGRVDCIVVGADRIATNGDSANKIGTYMLAVLAKHHSIPFYVAAPTSTLDREMATGAAIEVEQRSSSELTHIEGVAIAPPDCNVYNPAFDVTPGELITAIVTEDGMFKAPYNFRKEA